MSALLDTSVVLRYFTGDTPDAAERATQIIDQTSDLYISGIALMETAHVLRTVYSVPRESIVDHLIELIRKENISVLGIYESIAVQALLMCRPSGRVSIADAMIWASARSNKIETIYSFDQRFPNDGVEVRGIA